MNTTIYPVKTEKKNILEVDLFAILGLEESATNEDREAVLEFLNEEIFVRFVDEDLLPIIGEEKFDELTKEINEDNVTVAKVMKRIENEVEASSTNLEEAMDLTAEKVYKDFVNDQIKGLEDKNAKQEDEIKKTENVQIISQLTELFKSDDWTKMGELFKKFNLAGDQSPKKLVLHL